MAGKKLRRYVHKSAILVAALSFLFGLDYAIKEWHNQNVTKAQITNNSLRELDCLTKNIHWESRGEPLAGKIAVAQVTLNRVADGRFGDDVCSVVYQKTNIAQRLVCQFSWVCEGKAKINERDPRFKQAMHIAFNVLAFDAYKDVIPKNVLFFHASFVNPNWPHTKVTQIGNHVFYSKGKR
jgi:spore germination cell wall hydrolase CwlJ-like protein